MKNARKILITTATSEIFIRRRRQQQKTFRLFCPACEKETEMFDINSAVTSFGIGTRRLIRAIENGTVHSTELENGHLFVCAGSLSAALGKTKIVHNTK